MSALPPVKDSTKIDVSFTTSGGFSGFLEELKASVVVSTYQTGNLFLFGPDHNDTLAICAIKLSRPMGLCQSQGSLWVGDQRQIVRFNNILPEGVAHAGHDKIFIPQLSWTTGDIDGHDIVREASGRVLFVNTLYSCVAGTSESSSFAFIWRPPCITEMAPEDRCHLNGLALRDGMARYATAFSQHNTKQGWRKERDKQGLIWDISDNSIVVSGLTMPHSPRWYRDTLWCLESGRGTFGKIDFKKKCYTPLVTLAGYVRGLTFVGDFAFIGSSMPRENSDLRDTALEKSLAERGASQKCGIFVVDLRSNKLVHFVHISEGVQEVYDVAIIPNSLRPWAYAPDAEEVSHLLSIS